MQDKKKTLKLSSGTLGLSKSSSGKLSITPGTQIKKPVSKASHHSGKNTVVVVTKSRSSISASALHDSTHKDSDSLTNQERERKLQLLRQAETERKIEEERKAEELRVQLAQQAEEEKKKAEILAKQQELQQAEEEKQNAPLIDPQEQEKSEQAGTLIKRDDILKNIALRRGKVRNLNLIDKSQKQESAETAQEAAPENDILPIDTKSHIAGEKPYSKSHSKPAQAADVKEEREISINRRFADKKRDNRKLSVTQVMMMDKDDEPIGNTRSLASIRRAKEKAKRRATQSQDKEKIIREVVVSDVISIQELASRMSEKAADVIKTLMKLGMMVTLNQLIDSETAELVVSEFGHKYKRATDEDLEKSLIQAVEEKPENLKPRAPVVTIMGHVDHGKTSLLDALRSTDVAAGEAGGITQHIGAYQIQLSSNQYITFLDTPGHAAFTAMRLRGAQVTDIVVLIVAADDGIMEQTIEAINHAKAAKVPIIVAINKIDKPEANVTKVKNELLQHDLVPEDMGGDIIVVEISAKQRINLNKLEEIILLQSEVLELKADPNRAAQGAVIEAKVDKGRGPIATLLIQKGTLKVGDIIVAGTAYGKIRALINDKGQTLEEAGPSMPVEILGLNTSPIAGDTFTVVPNEKAARDISELRERKLKEKKLIATGKVSLEQLFMKAGQNGQQELAVVIKADVQGSVEAIANSLTKLATDEIAVKIIHAAVGGITESDIILASASDAIIIGFNVRANNQAKELEKTNNVDIRYYSVIYHLVDDIKAAMSGMLSPHMREEYLGTAEVRQVFNLTKYGKVAGCYVTDGLFKRHANARIVRDDVVIHDGKLKALKRFKNDIKEVKSGLECGISFEKYDDIKEGDKFEAYELIEEARQL